MFYFQISGKLNELYEVMNWFMENISTTYSLIIQNKSE